MFPVSELWARTSIRHTISWRFGIHADLIAYPSRYTTYTAYRPVKYLTRTVPVARQIQPIVQVVEGPQPAVETIVHAKTLVNAGSVLTASAYFMGSEEGIVF